MRIHLGRLAAALLFCALICSPSAGFAGSAADELQKAIPLDQLPSAAQKAKQQFHPVKENIVQRRRQAVREARQQLDQLLAGWSERNRKGWKKYLEWDKLESELDSKAAPQETYRFLGRLRNKMRINHKGLERPQFMRLRDRISKLRDSIYFAHNQEIKNEFSSRVDDLAKRIEQYSKSPNSVDASEIGQTIGWLEAGGQSPQLVNSVRSHFLQPNLIGRASKSLLSAAVDRSINRTVPVHDYILGASVNGTATTDAQLSLELVDNPRQAELQLVMDGAAYSNSTAYARRVAIYTTGTTSIDSQLRVLMDDRGIHLEPAVASCYTNSSINGVGARSCLVRKIAYRRALAQSGQASYIAARRAEQRVAENMDEETAESFQKPRESFETKFRDPLLRRGEFPRLMRFSTSEDSLNVKMIQANDAQLAAPNAPPRFDDEHDLMLQVHNTMVMNFSEAVFGGREVWDDEMDKAIADFTGKKPDGEAKEEDEEQNPWRITFADHRPISAEFEDQLVTIRMRLEEIGTGEIWDDAHKHRKPERLYGNPTAVTYVDDEGKKRRLLMDDKIYFQAVYKIERDGDQFKLVRQQQKNEGPGGDVQMVDLLSRYESYDRAVRGGFHAKSLNDRFLKSPTIVRTVIARAFKNSLFKQEIPLEGLEFPGRLENLGKLYVQELASGGNWLRIGWDRPNQSPDTPQVAASGE